MGRRARAYAGEHYGREALAARYLGLLEDVVRERREGRR